MQKKVFFYNGRKEKLAGILHTPKKKTDAAAVICHGYGSSKDNKGKWAEAFCKKGIAALRFDFSGHGDSEGAFKDMTISKLIDDLSSAIDFLKSLGYKKFGVTGHSLGGAVAIAAASNDVRIKAIAPVSAPVDWKRQLDEYKTEWKNKRIIRLMGRKLKYSFYEDAARYNPRKIIKSISCPVLLIHGDSDDLVGVAEARSTYSMLRSRKKLEIMANTGHEFTGSQYRKMINLTADWLRKWLC